MIPAEDKIARILETGGELALCEASGLQAPAVVAELTDGTIAEGLHYCSVSRTLFEAGKIEPAKEENAEVKPAEEPAKTEPTKTAEPSKPADAVKTAPTSGTAK